MLSSATYFYYAQGKFPICLVCGVVMLHQVKRISHFLLRIVRPATHDCHGDLVWRRSKHSAYVVFRDPMEPKSLVLCLSVLCAMRLACIGNYTFLVNEKCTNVTNMTLHEESVLFGNVKDFESNEIFAFIILFTKFVLCRWKMENKYAFWGGRICKTTDQKSV